jgi:hypothetical protein
VLPPRSLGADWVALLPGNGMCAAKCADPEADPGMCTCSVGPLGWVCVCVWLAPGVVGLGVADLGVAGMAHWSAADSLGSGAALGMLWPCESCW